MKNDDHIAAGPPPELGAAKKSLLKLPGVQQAGLTLDPEGKWALIVWTEQNAQVPLPGVGECYRGFRVIYSGHFPMPEARPAFPDRGE